MAFEIPAVAAAMDLKILQLDQITNNLANAATPGFKAEHLHFLKNMAENNPSSGDVASLGSLVVDFAQGMPQQTGNPLDLQLQGDGFFVVGTKESQAFTRKGDFTINRLNQIVTQAGDPVLGEGGPITLTKGKIEIGSEGSVYVDGSPVGKLRVVDFASRQALTNAGGGLYRDDGAAGMKKVEKPNVSSGVIELSNVNVIKEMSEMININRSFEAYSKIIQTLSEQDKLSTGRIGRVG